MSSVSLKIGDGTVRFHHATLRFSALQLLMLASIISTNLFALYAFSFLPSPSATTDVGDHKNLSVISEHVSLILREIEASERRLHQIEHELAGYETLNPAKPGLLPELKIVLACHPLPLSRDSRTGITSSPPWYPPLPIPALAPPSSPSSPPSCPTAMPPLAPPSTPSSPSSYPRPASPYPTTAAPRLPLP